MKYIFFDERLRIQHKTDIIDTNLCTISKEAFFFMEKVRYGLIGIGQQGSFYAQYLTGGMAAFGAVPTNAVLGALCDIDPEKQTMCDIARIVVLQNIGHYLGR